MARNAEGIRWDHLFIVDQVPQGSRVLDLGCGRGTLLKMLADRKGVRGTGIEIVEEKVYDAVTKGVTVYHGDFNEGLSYYHPEPDPAGSTGNGAHSFGGTPGGPLCRCQFS